jgi:hypothetical protein
LAHFIGSRRSCPKSRRDFGEWFDGGFESLDDFLVEKNGIEEIVGFFEAFVAVPENIEADLLAVMSSS